MFNVLFRFLLLVVCVLALADLLPRLGRGLIFCCHLLVVVWFVGFPLPLGAWDRLR